MTDKPNGAILKLIRMKYTGEELEAMLKAWEKYTTWKSDCATTARFKELARIDYAKKLMQKV
jgi:hypothetical protein